LGPAPGASGAAGGTPAQGASGKVDPSAVAAAAMNALAGARAREKQGSEPAAPMPALQKGSLVQVSSEIAPKVQAGEVGTCISVDEKAGTVCYTPAGSKTGLDKKVAAIRDVVVRLAIPPARADKKRALRYLGAERVKLWLTHWLQTEFDEAPVCRDTQLDYAELDAGAFELLWRVLPPKTVYMPPFLSRLIALGGPREEGWIQLVEKAQELVKRGEVVLVPIHAMGPGHWTLLVLEREGASVQEPVLHAAAPSAAGRAPARDPVRAQAQIDREQETMLILVQKDRPALLPPDGWRARYYETLHKAHMPCWNVGSAFLKALEFPVHMPAPEARENASRQDACDCGYWALHYMEEEARRKRGEGSWTTRYDLAYRVELLAPMVEKLKEQRKSDKKAETAAKLAAKAEGRHKKAEPAVPGS